MFRARSSHHLEDALLDLADLERVDPGPSRKLLRDPGLLAAHEMKSWPRFSSGRAPIEALEQLSQVARQRIQ